MSSPIAIFVYKRPYHTAKVLESLLDCSGFDKSDVYVYADGPKNESDTELVLETRKVTRSILGSNATYIDSDINIGLSKSITRGVNDLCGNYGRVIVLEDDLVTSMSFLMYMNEALDRYANDPSVMQISGYMFPVRSEQKSQQCGFLPLTTSWGWATWKRAWSNYDPNVLGWESLLSDPEERLRFNLNGTFDFLGMLKKQMEGRIDSWAVRWYWSVFKLNGLVLYPPESLVQNIGLDGSGTHGWRTYRGALSHDAISNTPVTQFPESIEIDSRKMELVLAHLKAVNSTPLARIKRILTILRIIK